MNVSVLTLVKNRPAHLAQLVEGLRRATIPPRELIIVDMSDPPESPPRTEFPTVVVRLETAGLPLAAARNLAASHARSDSLLFLDVDCIPMADLGRRMAETLSETDKLICAPVLYLAPDEARGGWSEAALLASGVPHPVRNFPSEGLREESNIGLFWSLAFGIRRSRFEAVGGFDERFTGYGAEDTDFGMRVHASGAPLAFMGGAGAFHQHHAAFDPPLQHFDDIIRNALIYKRKWGVWPMEGWLAAFARMGLIRLQETGIERLRDPMAAEIRAARKPAAARF
jgi:GT2 family glycosyltransferase